MTKKAEQAFLKSEFYSEIVCTVKARNYYLELYKKGRDADIEKALDECNYKLQMVRLALDTFTDNLYKIKYAKDGNLILIRTDNATDSTADINN